MLDPDRIRFRPLAISDLPLTHRWLNTEHVMRWYSPKGASYEEVVTKYGAYIRGEKPTRPYLILYSAAPIGYIQTYRIADWPEYARHVGVEEGAAGLDLFIGEPAYRHQGLGHHTVRRFLAEIIFGQTGAMCCVLGPEPENRAAIRTYEKAGFRYLKTVRISGEEQPEYLMRIGWDEL